MKCQNYLSRIDPVGKDSVQTLSRKRSHDLAPTGRNFTARCMTAFSKHAKENRRGILSKISATVCQMGYNKHITRYYKKKTIAKKQNKTKKQINKFKKKKERKNKK